MKSAFECYQYATRCEGKARSSRDDFNRTALLAVARHWRGLGELAKQVETGAIKVSPREPAEDQTSH